MRLERFLQKDPKREGSGFSTYACEKRPEQEPTVKALRAIGCHARTTTLRAAKKCWQGRPL